MATVTFVIVQQQYRDRRGQFTVLRISEDRLDIVSHHATAEQAWEAAKGYASRARFAGLDARIFQRD